MRVATRRLRAALEIFEPCFPREEFKAGLQQVKALADALGERRDRDVAIASLEKVAASMTASDRPGIETLVGRLREEQATANKGLERFVSDERLASLCDQLTELVASVRVPAGEGEDLPVERIAAGGGDNGAGGKAEERV
jgi:CHAD domain-containing protein